MSKVLHMFMFHGLFFRGIPMNDFQFRNFLVTIFTLGVITQLNIPFTWEFIDNHWIVFDG